MTSSFQELIETIEALSLDDQELLIEIIRKRLIQQRRAELAAEIAEARDAYQRGEVRRGTVADFKDQKAWDKFIKLSNEISERWKGLSAVEEIRAQRER